MTPPASTPQDHPPLTRETAFLTIDVQEGFSDSRWGTRNNPDFETNLDALLSAWREAALPLFHVQHHSTEPDSPLRSDHPGSAPKAGLINEGEPVITKQVNSAFIGTNLEELLHEQGISTLILTGLTTDHCVSTTARMAENLGFSVYVVADATAAFDRTGHDGTHYEPEVVHDLALAQLNGEFATIIDTAPLLAALSEA
ncbi:MULTISPECIES: cysteine hydrolase family protein [unclassified Haladaptatus]|uniref:cysteine hydrolase family protein n=1 Tax=unclassified Haladaptatus TaxID=2622732 RepID=UPI0023E89F45|nr:MULTISPECIES: cysteine hydrolase family protein [unclassified Haladaptatus]